MVRESKSKISFFSVGCPLRRRFVSFLRTVERLYRVDLPMPKLCSDSEEAKLSSFKKFCSGLIERERSHCWRGAISRLPRVKRMSIAMSLFLFRKVLPSNCPDLQDYLQRMTTPDARELDQGFLDYVRKRVPELFPTGWDKGKYENACLNSVLPVKSCTQRGQGKGGARAEVLSRGAGWNDHVSYVLETLSRENPVEFTPCRLSAVETGGKWRIVSSSSVEANLLRPLHSTIYNHLSGFKWLLRGDAKANRFSEFTRVEQELFCSGDYESATDNLSSEVQKLILDLLLRNSTSVPKGIKESAVYQLESVLTVAGGPELTQARGQLMGNLLSFPLLCIVNYLAFRYYSGTSGYSDKCNYAPVRVNGDDIIFRAPQEVIDRWMEGVHKSGLTLSRGKTLVDPVFFSLNSNLLKATPTKVQQVPFIRPKAVWHAVQDDSPVASLQGRWRSFFLGYHGTSKRMLREWWLRENRKTIIASRRSLIVGLGINATMTNLVDSGLWDREAFYLSLPKGVEKPLPPSPSLVEQKRVPEGWRFVRVSKITRKHRELQKEVGPAFVQCAWSPLKVVQGTKERIKDWKSKVALAPYWNVSSRSDLSKRARLIGCSNRNMRRLTRPKIFREACPDNSFRSDWIPWREQDVRKFLLATKFTVLLPAEARCASIDNTEVEESTVPSYLPSFSGEASLSVNDKVVYATGLVNGSAQHYRLEGEKWFVGPPLEPFVRNVRSSHALKGI